MMHTLVIEDQKGNLGKVLRPVFIDHVAVPDYVMTDALAIYDLDAEKWLKVNPAEPFIDYLDWIDSHGIYATAHIPNLEPVLRNTGSDIMFVLAYMNIESGFYCGAKS